MRLLKEIRERRLLQIMGAYLVTGFVAVEAVSQLVDSGFLPPVSNTLIWVFYLFGAVASLIFAWFHGAPGRQYGPRGEILLQGSLAVMAIATAAYVYVNREIPLDLATESGLPPTSIAVLYFDDLTGGELAHVADGITDALIDRLSEVRSLDVVSANGVRQYRELDLSPDSVARALGVGTVIEGTVEQTTDELRVTTRLVDGFSGADIERATVEMAPGAFLDARDSVAEGVSRLLRRRLGEDVRVRELRAGTSSVDAWSLVQAAERLMNDGEDNFESGGDPAASVDAYRRADSLLALAESVDPQWEQPSVGRARAAYRNAFFSAIQGSVDQAYREIQKGINYANRALAVQPGDGEALEQRGSLQVLAATLEASSQEELDSLLAGAIEDLEAAVEAKPSLATAHAMLSFALVGAGDNIGSVLRARRALEEDAYLRGADRIYDRLFYALYDEERFRDAGEACEEGRRRFPDNPRFVECRLWLMATPDGSTDPDSAWRTLARLDSLAPVSQRRYKHGVGQILVAGVLRNAGMVDSAASVLARVDHSEGVDVQRNLFQYEAAILATTGRPDVDGALEALRRWVAMTPGVTLPEGSESHWWWRNLRGQDEFRGFLDRGR